MNIRSFFKQENLVRNRNFLLFILFLSIFHVLVFFGVSIAKLQLLLAPIFVLILHRIKLLTAKGAVFAVLMLILFGGIKEYYSSPAFYNVIIIPFADDKFDAQSQLLHEGIVERQSELSPAKFGVINSILNRQDTDFFKHKGVLGIIGGKGDLVKIRFAPQAPSSLSSIGGFTEIFPEFIFINQVEEISLTINPIIGTGFFISWLFDGLYHLANNSGFNDFGLEEINLLEASKIHVFWGGLSHRAYPLWLLGNIKFKECMNADVISKKCLNIANKYYKEALDNIGDPKDNKKLVVGILNNLSILKIYKYLLAPNKKLLNQAYRMLKNAEELSVHKGGIPQKNLIYIQDYI